MVIRVLTVSVNYCYLDIMLDSNERKSKMTHNGIYLVLFSKKIPEIELFMTDILTLHASPIMNANALHK